MLVFCSLALGFLGKRLCFVVRCLLSVEKCLLCSEARALAAECSEKLPKLPVFAESFKCFSAFLVEVGGF